MKIIYSKYFPIRPFFTFMFFGLLFVREDKRPLSEVQKRHVEIHAAQARELWYIGFYLWYFIEWLCLLIKFRKWVLAYMHVSFEREAYIHQYWENYLDNRKKFSFLNYFNKYV